MRLVLFDGRIQKAYIANIPELQLFLESKKLDSSSFYNGDKSFKFNITRVKNIKNMFKNCTNLNSKIIFKIQKI